MNESRPNRVLDFADFRALGEFLRRAPHLARSSFVRRALGKGGHSGLEGGVIEQLGLIVDELLDELPSRQRTIIERHDFGGESRSAVAADLGISIRHFCRERGEARRHITRALALREQSKAVTAIVSESSDVDSLLRLSEVLDNSGRWREGAAVLDRVANELASSERRVNAELQLSRLYSNAQRFALARHHVDIARTLSLRLEPAQRWRAFAADVIAANISVTSGDFASAAELLPRSIAQLRSHAYQTSDVGIEAAIADALALQANLAALQGDYKKAKRPLADILSIPRTGPQIQLYARSLSVAMDLYLTGPSDTGYETLVNCYHEAVAHGFLRIALSAASGISIHHRYRKQPKEAVAFLLPVEEIAYVFGASSTALDFFAELTLANIDTSAFEAALVSLRGLSENKEPGAVGLAELLASMIHFGLGEYQTALAKAESAETVFVKTGFDRFLPITLLCQSEALIALGLHDHARRIVPVLIDLAQKMDQHDRLAAAYDLMAKVTGRTTYVTQARKVRLRG
jgi:tetratricopeptide (TPR) repeat protein